MLNYVIGATAVLAVLLALWWAFLRENKVEIPQALSETVETEEFMNWLAKESGFFIWGRDDEGRYYACTFGSLAARRIRRKAFELHQLRGAG